MPVGRKGHCGPQGRGGEEMRDSTRCARIPTHGVRAVHTAVHTRKTRKGGSALVQKQMDVVEVRMLQSRLGRYTTLWMVHQHLLQQVDSRRAQGRHGLRSPTRPPYGEASSIFRRGFKNDEKNIINKISKKNTSKKEINVSNFLAAVPKIRIKNLPFSCTIHRYGNDFRTAQDLIR